MLGLLINRTVNGIMLKHCESILTYEKVNSSQQILTRTCIKDCQQINIEKQKDTGYI